MTCPECINEMYYKIIDLYMGNKGDTENRIWFHCSTCSQSFYIDIRFEDLKRGR